MESLKKLAGAYLVGIAVVVAVWFIINTFFVDLFDVMAVWYVLDALMFAGLVLALGFNYIRKRKESGRDPGESVTRRYLEVNAAFYLTAGITVLFLHNWFSLLANGVGSLALDNHQAQVIWAFVDTLLPLTLGATGCALWREPSES